MDGMGPRAGDGSLPRHDRRIAIAPYSFGIDVSGNSHAYLCIPPAGMGFGNAHAEAPRTLHRRRSYEHEVRLSLSRVVNCSWGSKPR